MYPPSGSSSTPQRPPSAVEEEQIALFKKNTNFRSVTRNDPSVVEILETSVYSVIYLYDEAAGAWEKQKQEGPLFIVRREKAPEYALYMLNRQAVKNVTMPLIPGEMKVGVVDPTTLQVARRGEKVKRGIWFSDGAEDVERFRQTILRICGEPVKKPGGASPSVMPPTIPAISSSAVQATPPSDGLSRLFAGLTTTSGVTTPSKTGPPPMPSSNSSSSIPRAGPGVTDYDARHNGLAVPSAASNGHDRGPQVPPPLYQHPSQEPVAPAQPTPSQPPPSAAVPVSPASEATPFAPGQTVDDLLNSILGVASPLPPPKIDPPSRPAAQTPSQSERDASTAPQIQSPPLLPPNPLTSTRVGNASFAQAAGATSPIPPTTRPNLMTNLEAEFFRNQRSNAPSPANSTSNVPQPGPPAPPLSAPTAPYQTPPMAGQLPAAQSRGLVHPMVDAVVQPMLNKAEGGGMRPVGQIDEAGKRAFVQDLLNLIHTDQNFVDDVWRVYLSRTHPGPRG